MSSNFIPSICPLHPRYRGLRKPTTKRTLADGCSCHEYWANDRPINRWTSLDHQRDYNDLRCAAVKARIALKDPYASDFRSTCLRVDAFELLDYVLSKIELKEGKKR